jgi:F0F1-type ATP synthase membrane subunit b/b'
MDTLQILGTVLLSFVALFVFVIKLIVPWMKVKIDTKNGQITDLVEEVKRLSQGMCSLIEQGNQRQDEFMAKVGEICERQESQIERLMEQIREALERAA